MANQPTGLGERFEGLPIRVAAATFFPPTKNRLRFLKQLGVDDLIIWGTTYNSPTDLSFKELVILRNKVEDAGLRLFAIETLPAHFIDEIQLGKPGREQQLDDIVQIIRNMGRAKIPVLGYNWMPSGVWRTSFTNRIRGGATGTAFNAAHVEGAPLTHDRDYSEEEFWEYYEYFLRRVLPVAEEEGVKLAIHPNDPPIPKVGGIPMLFRSFESFKRAMDMMPSPNHGLTFCLGNWGCMGGDLLANIRYFGEREKLFYVHFQATNGTVPHYAETFVDLADYDAYEVLRTFHEVGFTGVMIPGHVPQIEGDTEWRTAESAARTPYTHPMGGHAARAYTIGYMRGMIHALNRHEGKRP